MMRTESSIMAKAFSHIYIERGIRNKARCLELCSHFPDAKQVLIDHYKDVFNRSRQNGPLQHASQNLILAEKRGQLIYPGAPVCQDFGNQHFYYASCMMNCLFDCEYCYLKGMYPSGNLVIFLNLEDVFAELDELLKAHPVYLCVSYDTDLMAAERLTGYVRRWTEYAASREGLTIEIRTKAGGGRVWESFTPSESSIFAFTVSPAGVIKAYEHGTASLESRILAAKRALEAGFPVRLCFDPMIFVPSWQDEYEKMLGQVAREIPMEQIRDVSIGSFRISKDYLKPIRKAEMRSAAVQFPFEEENGYYHYPAKLTEEMESFLLERLLKYVPGEKIFRWE